jgi:hypothetical protein
MPYRTFVLRPTGLTPPQLVHQEAAMPNTISRAPSSP